MPTESPRLRQGSGSGPRVHRDGFANDEAIGDELPNGLPRIGIADLADFVRIEPNLALPTAHNRGGKALLSSKIDPI